MPQKSLAYNVYNEHNRQQKSPDSLRIKALLDNTERIRTLFGGERGFRTGYAVYWPVTRFNP